MRSLLVLMDIGLEAPGCLSPERIRAQILTDSSGDDAKTGLKVIEKAKGKLSSVAGDAGYGTVASYHKAAFRRARVVVSPTRTESFSGGKPRSAERDKADPRVTEVRPALENKVLGQATERMGLGARFRQFDTEPEQH